MHEADGLGILGKPVVLGAAEPGLQVGVRDDVVIDAIPVLLFPRGVEQFEAGSDEQRAARDVHAVAEHHQIAVLQPVDVGHLRFQKDVRLHDLPAQPTDEVLGRRHVREQAVPLRDVTAQMVPLFHQDGVVPEQKQLFRRFHPGQAAADDDNVLLHRQKHLRLVGSSGLSRSSLFRPRYFALGSYSTPIRSRKGSTATWCSWSPRSQGS